MKSEPPPLRPSETEELPPPPPPEFVDLLEVSDQSEPPPELLLEVLELSFIFVVDVSSLAVVDDGLSATAAKAPEYFFLLADATDCQSGPINSGSKSGFQDNPIISAN